MRHIHFDVIDSTNAYLKREYEFCDNLFFVSASSQLNGKGRLDRTWLSNTNENVLASFIVKDIELINNFHYLSTYTAVVIARFLEHRGLKDVSLKWPNDIYVKGKKICGILLEGKVPNYVIVGFGLNVNQEEFPKDLRRQATSMKVELKEELELNKVREEIISRLYSFWVNFKGYDEGFENFIKSHNFLYKKRIKILKDNEIISGTVIDINSRNELLIDIGHKETTLVSSGEIEII